MEEKSRNKSKFQSFTLLGMGILLLVVFSAINLFGLYPNNYSYEETKEQFIVYEGVVPTIYTVEQSEVDELSKVLAIHGINSLNQVVLMSTVILFLLLFYIFAITRRHVRFNFENKLDVMHAVNICILFIFFLYNVGVYNSYVNLIRNSIERIFL
ncbi:hypothetical protein ACERII_14680 [Evansella sp. AB-rgal1]|uniref:hypothetical protein n=1 Tax=Evansella sp. AB-rgal1 TaxID=3242696 RepID=UPI00359DFF37